MLMYFIFNDYQPNKHISGSLVTVYFLEVTNKFIYLSIKSICLYRSQEDEKQKMEHEVDNMKTKMQVS